MNLGVFTVVVLSIDRIFNILPFITNCCFFGVFFYYNFYSYIGSLPYNPASTCPAAVQSGRPLKMTLYTFLF
jgi:hypothetical protein